jgi:hypothetical protein
VRLALVLTSLLALAGCAARLDEAGTAWGKAGAGIYQVTLDELGCARASAEAIQTYDFIVGGLIDVARVVVEERARAASYNGCMTAKGYARKG